MKLAPLREDELVAQLQRILESTQTRRVLIGIGDDAAVWQPSRSHRSVITTDALVEGVHFARETMTMFDAGWRAAAASLSDLAAMGARPVLATVALGVSADATLDELLDLYRGIAACASEARLAIAGGDATRAPALTIAFTAVGEVSASRIMLRSGGRNGDVVAVTGALGASRAGLDVARGLVSLEPEMEEAALRAHRRPQARLREGQWLAASVNVHAAIDCSDGTSTDLARLCEASRLGAVVESVPVAPAALSVATAIGEDPQAYALAGGEEYELIVAVDRRAFERLAARYRAHFGAPLLRIGTLREGSEVFRNDGGAETPLARAGWEHFGG